MAEFFERMQAVGVWGRVQHEKGKGTEQNPQGTNHY